jgi:hypothetical protein
MQASVLILLLMVSRMSLHNAALLSFQLRPGSSAARHVQSKRKRTEKTTMHELN